MTPNPTVFEVVLLLPNEERSVQVAVEEHIWDAAFSAGVVLPALCHQWRCLTCAGRLEATGERTSQTRQITVLKIVSQASFCFARGTPAPVYQPTLPPKLK